MKNIISIVALLCFVNALFAQNNMHVKKFNSTTFSKDVKATPALLTKNTTTEAQRHPEFGVLPYNSQCANCVELLDKRAIDSRFFIDPQNEDHTYSQQSHFPLHYKKSANDIWRTIDQRLRPTAPGVYEANNQPVPTKCDLNKKSTSLTEQGFEFEFNKNLTMYFFDEASVYTRSEQGNYSTYTIGEEGLTVKNIWPGMDMEQQFTAGQIKTNYVISSPLQLPIATGYMVIEDHFTLPEGYSFVESELGHHTDNNKYYQGDYHLKNSKGETLITYEKPVYIDGKAWGMHGSYKLLQSGNDYTLQTLVPVSWLRSTDNTYPLVIDPIVYGASKLGNFVQSGSPSAALAFTTMSLGSCPYHMSILVPGKSTITNAYVDVEYSLTFDNTCGTPPLPAPYCTFSQVSMEVKSDECNTSTGLLTCSPFTGPQTGTCTTDSNLVPGVNALQFSGLLPNACLPAQCPDYNLHFTLLNRDSACGDVCGYLCARGNMWRMTIEGQRQATDVAPFLTISNDTIYSSLGTGNQWYFEGSIIPGETDSFLVVTQTGNYTSQPVSAIGCNTVSNSIFYQVTTTNDIKRNTDINLYPNPVSNELTIATNGRIIEQLKIFAADGKLIMDTRPTNSKVDLSQLPKGNYTTQIRLKEGTKTLHFTKQ